MLSQRTCARRTALDGRRSRPADRVTGFTLAELLVVVGLLTVLAATLLPYFTRAFKIQRRIACANNLHKIGQAYGTLFGSAAVEGIQARLDAMSWTGALAPYVGDNKSIYICPEDEVTAVDPAGGMQGMCIEVFPRGALNDLSRHLWAVYLEQAGNNEWIWKMSTTQFNEFMKVSGESITTPYRNVYKGYVPDGDPYTWYVTFEDNAKSGGGDRDFYDAVLQVHYTATEIQFKVVVRASALSFSLARRNDTRNERQVLIPELEVNAYAAVPYAAGEASYGFNSVSAWITPGKDKLLALDYDYIVAVGSAFDDDTVARARHLDMWEPDPKNPSAPLPFARHFGKCNVLAANGTVLLVHPDSVNPNDPVLCKRYWDPR